VLLLNLYLAAVLCGAIGLAHSYLGEKYILVRLFRRDDLPKLFGSDEFTRRTLRFAWHLTSVAWWGLGAILVVVATSAGAELAWRATAVVGATFLVHAAVTGIASRGRHYAWIVFLGIALICGQVAFVLRGVSP
jgi:hypothetical protein